MEKNLENVLINRYKRPQKYKIYKRLRHFMSSLCKLTRWGHNLSKALVYFVLLSSFVIYCFWVLFLTRSHSLCLLISFFLFIKKRKEITGIEYNFFFFFQFLCLENCRCIKQKQNKTKYNVILMVNWPPDDRWAGKLTTSEQRKARSVSHSVQCRCCMVGKDWPEAWKTCDHYYLVWIALPHTCVRACTRARALWPVTDQLCVFKPCVKTLEANGRRCGGAVRRQAGQQRGVGSIPLQIPFYFQT